MNLPPPPETPPPPPETPLRSLPLRVRSPLSLRVVVMQVSELSAIIRPPVQKKKKKMNKQKYYLKKQRPKKTCSFNCIFTGWKWELLSFMWGRRESLLSSSVWHCLIMPCYCIILIGDVFYCPFHVYKVLFRLQNGY